MVSDESVPPYMRPPLSKELWRNEGPEEMSFTDWQGHRKPLLLQPDSFYREHANLQLILDTKVLEVDPAGKTATLADGTRIGFEAALLATGAQPHTLPQAPHAHTLRSLADYQRIRKALRSHPKPRVLIVGGGFLGSELAVAIRGLPNQPQVTQCFPEGGLMSLVLPKYLSEWTGDRLRSLGIKVLPKTEIVEAQDNSGSWSVRLSDGTSMEADLIIAAVGVKPSIPLSTGSDSSEHLQVNGPCFGAGDAVEYWDGKLQMKRRTEHYDHAVESGRLAGLNMIRYCQGLELLPYTHESMFW